MTDLDRRNLIEPTCSDDVDDTVGYPIDSFWLGAFLVVSAFSLLGFAAMVVGLYAWAVR